MRVVWILVLLASPWAWAAGDPESGKALYAVCAACHGPNGEGVRAMNAPKLAGLEPWYIKRQIDLFKAGARGGPGDVYGAQMRPMAMTLASAQAVEDVIAYIGTFTVEPTPATVDGDVAAGKARYALCAACHGARGEGNKALNAPALAGQEDWYIVRQLLNYKSGLRGKHPQDTFGKQMVPMAMALADESAINDVAAYLHSLQ